MKYTWGRGFGTEGQKGWQVLEPAEPEGTGRLPRCRVIFSGIKNEYIARAVSVLLNADDES
jgi:hypothetical protein